MMVIYGGRNWSDPDDNEQLKSVRRERLRSGCELREKLALRNRQRATATTEL